MAKVTRTEEHRAHGLQGWNRDPFGRFEHRYFSEGRPTRLVRTAGVESRDDPTPAGSPRRPAVPARPAEPEFPGTIEVWVYPRREHRKLARATLLLAVLAPVIVWVLLVPGTHGRVFVLIDYVVLVAAVVALVFVARVRQPD